MYGKLSAAGRELKQQIDLYQRVLRHPRTPKLSKLILALAIGYTFLPFDIIPDFIPGLGHLDDVIIVPALVVLALKLIPQDIIEECRVHAATERQTGA
jgi:uncharacterized membrane protein YkvA (DUF1232 family)